jgi:hypothetical protein
MHPGTVHLILEHAFKNNFNDFKYLSNQLSNFMKKIICKANKWSTNYSQLISSFHRASLLLVTFINQLTHPIITVVDVKILLFKSLNDTH